MTAAQCLVLSEVAEEYRNPGCRCTPASGIDCTITRWKSRRKSLRPNSYTAPIPWDGFWTEYEIGLLGDWETARGADKWKWHLLKIGILSNIQIYHLFRYLFAWLYICKEINIVLNYIVYYHFLTCVCYESRHHRLLFLDKNFIIILS